ncbi:CHAT domain-containing protein [Leptolyngbya boryana CZ1]|uniref:CHAT domain-containing protein n=1 Tax=Leptolyngbya boryana CZ1 TaxID=3060204 RepID=A0AA96WXW0_LEPBY|nr:CHAT domain-containing protein [Leptolyngbya boryana]WNZ46129.1 CHAT domain-containing protein [Leptolyngbya boryana CZ1]
MQSHEQRRLESQRDSLQKTWNLTHDKLQRLRRDFAIETDTATKFKLEQQISDEEVKLAELERQLSKIEQALSRSNSFLQGVTSSQTLIRYSAGVLDAGQSVGDLPKIESDRIQDVEQSPTPVGKPFHPRLDQKFPQDFAVIYVEEQDNEYIARLRHSEQTSLDTEPDEPCLSLSKQIDERFNPFEIRGEQSNFSRYKQAKRIRIWLNRLKEIVKYVVIHDRTDFEIAWEMLRLSEDEHLGSSFTTIRWQDLQDPWSDDDEYLPLQLNSYQCHGSIVAYANQKELQGVAAEMTLLKQYEAECFEDIKDFFGHLKQTRSRVSLVFIASHGFLEEKDIRAAALGEKSAKGARISLRELEGRDLRFLKTWRSIVFMNACHSGRLRKGRRCEERLGFATYFLQQGAAGVIGTMGEVKDEYAPRIAENFLSEYRQAPSLSVAEILQKIRADALRKLQEQETDEHAYLFLFTFMYVYYGNPMTVLRLAPSGGQAND